MKSPCRTCENLYADKNNETCRSCQLRREYVRSIGHERLPNDNNPTERIFMPETQLDPLPTGKICRKCGTAKPVSEFTRKKATQDGLDLYCRSCKAEKGKAERERRRNQKQKNKQKTHRQSKIISQTDPIVDNVHMVNLGPIMDRLKHHFEEARKIIQFLDVLQETTGARIDIPKFEE